jgi:hypothetical protein
MLRRYEWILADWTIGRTRAVPQGFFPDKRKPRGVLLR